MTTIKQLAGITSQHNEIVKRVVNGSLDPTAVKRALQDIIQGKLLQVQNWNPPTWWRTPDQQLERAHKLWPNAVLPEPPKEFVPRTKSEVLLLHVPDTFDSLWDKVDGPQDYTKYRWGIIKSDSRRIRLSLNKREYTEPIWLAFDSENGKGERPDSFWGQADIAASEVFSALIQFPDWKLSWFYGASASNLSGYQLRSEVYWSLVPCLGWWTGGRQLELDAHSANDGDPRFASPSVRVC